MRQGGRKLQGYLLVFINLFRTLRLAYQDPQFKALALFVLVIMLVGTVVYRLVEKWRWLDALYFSVMTLTTIGYGDLVPQSDLGKLFTIFYVLSGLGVFAAFVTALAEKQRQLMLEDRQAKNSE